MLVFQLATGLIWFFVVVRFLVPLAWGAGPTLLMSLLLLAASQHHFLVRRWRKAQAAPEVPRPAGVLVNVLFGLLLLLAVFQAALDLLLLAVWLGGFSLTPPSAIRYGGGALALSLALLGVYQATRLPRVREIEIAIADLPIEFDGYRLLQLTDLHLSRLFPRSWAQGVVARANKQRADLIVLTGDLIDGSLAARNDDVEPLADLKAHDGVFVAVGNHEYYFGYEGWVHRYQQLGMVPLTNRHTLLERGGVHLVLAGVTDSAAGRFQLPRPDLREALAGAPPGAPVVLLAHQPRLASQAAQAGVALQLAGHTHGGMVLGLDRLVARFNHGYVSGLYRVEKMQLYVSNGTALWNGFALRLGVPPELTVITLRVAPGG